jgi:hypothetical protein
MGILDLADELLRIILEYVASEPEKPISLERRAYLSQESFKLPIPPDQDDAHTIAQFRLTCRRFALLGSEWLDQMHVKTILTSYQSSINSPVLRHASREKD